MSKKLTAMVSDNVYIALHTRVPQRQIGAFISSVVEEYWRMKDLESSYAEAAADEARESEAKEWEKISMKDASNAPW
jgi:hypothetical protein